MAKLFFLLFATCLLATALSIECPSYTKVTTCSPKCVQDTECSAIGGKCCPNICNAKSCALPNQLGSANSGSSNYKGSSSGGTGTYCGNVKCSSFEKCQNDRATSRPKCVRA